MRRRTRTTLIALLAVVSTLALAIYLRKQAPPEPARVLPEADAIVYFNLKPLRTLTHFDQHPVAHDAMYQSFIDATGIQFERDLDEAAFAIHRLPNANGPNGPVAYSEVFEGHFDGGKLTQYLATESADTETYAGHTIYRIPHDGRNVRVAVLGYDMVAVSNTPTTEQIHSIIDRYHTAALPFSGSTLLDKHYPAVPLLAQVWGVGKIGLPFSGGNNLSLMGIPLPLPADTTFIASIRYLGSLHLRVEEIAPDADAAKASARMANVALQIFKSLPGSLTNNASSSASASATADAAPDPSEAAMATLLNSATVEQKGNRVLLRATIPVELLEGIFSTSKDIAAPATGGANANSQ